MSKNLSRLGRRIPRDWGHVEKHPYGIRSLKAITVNRSLAVPYTYDQGLTSGCVAYSLQTMMGIYNRKRYDCRWLYCEACAIDNDAETSCVADVGTYVVAGLTVLCDEGDRVAGSKKTVRAEGVKSFAWATTVDQIRTAIAANKPVEFGINWYTNFDTPVMYNGSWWIGRGDWGKVAGGHAICCFGASDKLQAVRLVNTWGSSYPRVYISYDSIKRLLSEDGEAGVVLDRKIW